MTLAELRRKDISTVKQIFQQWMNKAVDGKLTPDEREIFKEIQKIWKEKQDQEYI